MVRSTGNLSSVNNFSTTGRCTGPPRYDVSIRQAGIVAIVTSSFKIFLILTFPLCGATCYIVPSRPMIRLFNGVHFGYRSVVAYWTFCECLSEFETSTMADGINYTDDLPRYVFDRLFYNLTDKSYWNVDDRNNVDMLRIISHRPSRNFNWKSEYFRSRLWCRWLRNLQNSWIRWRCNTNCDINGE